MNGPCTEQAMTPETRRQYKRRMFIAALKHRVRMFFFSAWWRALHFTKLAWPYSRMLCRLNLYRQFPGGRCQWCGEKHGLYDSSEYRAWSDLKRRCLNRKNKAWHLYGARGISVCERWLSSFDNFLADMGRKPVGRYSIDRIDNDGNYEPGNCRWATQKQQLENRRPRSEWKKRKANDPHPKTT